MRRLQVPVLLAVALTAGCGLVGDSTVTAEPSDRYPSTTASDWVTYADFVAVVKVAEDRRAAPAQEARERGEGFIDRSVTLTVEKIVWRKADAPPAPATIVYPALGWMFRDGNVENTRELVPIDRPRYEQGHRYVSAFVWEPSRCYEGDGRLPARWVGLGSGSALPFDGERLGAGEFAGEGRNLEEAEEYAATLPADSVAAQVTGERLDALRTVLAEAQPKPKEDYGPQPSTC